MQKVDQKSKFNIKLALRLILSLAIIALNQVNYSFEKYWMVFIRLLLTLNFDSFHKKYISLT